MIIQATTPTRISLAGGGTDVDPYCELYGGSVINMAINLCQHVELYTDDDMWEKHHHEFPSDADPKLCYRILENYGMNGMHHSRVISSFDGIIGAGLGSSAAFAVCLIGALRKLTRMPQDRKIIAKEAYDTEVKQLGWYGGRQDQYAAAFGGLNLIEFNKEVKVKPFIREDAEALRKWMVLFYTGNRKFASNKIQKGFKKLSKNQIKTLNLIKEKVSDVEICIKAKAFSELGHFINEMWQLKKKSNKGISNAKIDAIYDYGIKNGALGGKLLGAGSGGYMVFICNPNKQENLIKKMAEKGIEDIDFSVDYNGLQVRRL